MEDSTRKKIASLLQLAIKGELKLEKLHEEYPEDLKSELFWASVWDDLETAVEHFPFKLFSGKPDSKSWNKSRELKNLKIDLALLETKFDNQKLNKLRNGLVERKDLTAQNVATELELLLNSSPT